MSKPALDAIDREIISRLSEDARMSNRAVAELLGVTEGTIRARLKRLLEARLIRFTALTDLARVGPMRIAFIRVRTSPPLTRKAAEAIAAMDEINCVILTTGAYGVLAMGPLRDLEPEIETITARIGALPGVLGTETSIVIEPVKYNLRTAKILTPQRDDGEDEEPDEVVESGRISDARRRSPKEHPRLTKT